jgi:PTH1 family peptidyl-tRNA hydrolase
MFVIVGLGNPGKKYQQHRHNAGFMVIDALAGIAKPEKKFESEFFKVVLEGEDALLLKPVTFMNLSGLTVKYWVDFYHADLSRVIVIHDDSDLALGRIKIKTGGGDAGHRGVRSIAESLESRDFIRVRIGTGRPENDSVSMTEYVLSDFSESDFNVVKRAVNLACEAVKMIIARGISCAMNAFNRKPVEHGRLKPSAV